MNPQDIRTDARVKLDASVKYIRDIKIPGMWYGLTIRSSQAHANIKQIDFDPQFDWNKVAIVTADDIPVNYVAMLEKDMPFLAKEKVRYIGEPILLIAAKNQEDLTTASQHINIDYESLPAIFDMQQAENNSVKIFNDDNVFKHININRGNLNKIKKSADAEIAIQTESGYQEHLYLEPQGVIAVPKENGIEIRGSLQCPYYVKNALCNMFVDQKHITVIQSPTGGAFGGKEDYPSLLAGHAALLADKCRQPVAMFYNRREDVQFTTKRHPAMSTGKAWLRKDGKILGIDINILLDGGAYCTLSQVVLARTALAALGNYHVPNACIVAKAVATNTVPNGAFRGFGGPQAIFSIEMLMEKIAQELNISPSEIRRKNMIREGQKTATGQILRYSVSAYETFDDVVKRSDYKQKYKKYKKHNDTILKQLAKGDYSPENAGEMLKGIGICAFLHGAGFTGTGENKIKAKLQISLDDDGYLTILSGSTEMGQGEETIMKTILANALKTDRSQIRLAEINTDMVPDSGPTVASRTTMIVGSLIVEAAKDIIIHLRRSLNKEFGGKFNYRDGVYSNGKKVINLNDAVAKYSGLIIEKEYAHPPIIKFDDVNWTGDAYPVFSWAASVAELAVDPVTFEIKVNRYITTHDIGKAINHDQSVAQIQGGSLQGIGYALYEKIENREGRIDITGFTDYIIPTAMDMPDFDVHIMENPYPYGPFGAKGLGELPLVGAAPAVVSALNMIFGKVFTRIPVLPEHLADLFYN